MHKNAAYTTQAINSVSTGKNKSVNAAYGVNPSLIRNPHRTHKCIVWKGAKFQELHQVVEVV